MKYQGGAILAADCMVHVVDSNTGITQETRQSKKLRTNFNYRPSSLSDIVGLSFASAGLELREVDRKLGGLPSGDLSTFVSDLKWCPGPKDHPLAYEVANASRSKKDTGIDTDSSAIMERKTNYAFLSFTFEDCNIISVNEGMCFPNLNHIALGSGISSRGKRSFARIYNRGMMANNRPTKEQATSWTRELINDALQNQDQFLGYILVRVTITPQGPFYERAENMFATQVPDNPFARGAYTRQAFIQKSWTVE